MPEEYQLPVEGYYQQPPVDPMGYALPIAQPQPIPSDIPRVYINTAPREEPVIEQKPEPILHTSGKQLKAVDYDPWANLGMAGVEDKSGKSEHPLIKQLFGLGGEDRVQLWPERMVRAGVTAAHDVMTEGTLPPGLRREDFTDIPDPSTLVGADNFAARTGGGSRKALPAAAQPTDKLIEQAQAMSALAGTGGLAGTTEEATLGSGPFLRPALKHDGKLYKGKEGQQHLDVLPKELEADFNQKALSGEDISHYNFGFMNHKGQFLNRKAALDYAIKEGLVDPTAGQYGVFTSILLSDSSKPGIAIEAMKKPTFYSALEHNVNNIGQAKMTGDQWLGTLANKPGVKPEELQWTGLSDYLKENGKTPVTKEQIQQHLEQNKVELKEVSKGAKQDSGELWDKFRQQGRDELIAKGADPKSPHFENQAYDRAERLMSEYEKNTTTKYHSYQLPGGENYREMLLTLPEKGPHFYPDFETYYKATFNPKPTISKALDASQRQFAKADWDAKGGKVPINDHGGSRVGLSNGNYTSSHWDEPNILAHVRMNDRTIEGKKSLHVEEIQSDWHQQGREKGYRVNQEKQMDDLVKQRDEIKAQRDKLAPTGDTRAKWIEHDDKMAAVQTKINELGKSDVGVPDAPFKKSWHELALKRMLREAAEKGYDRLSWTPGEAQAARYDLSKDVKNVYLHNPVFHGEKDVRGSLVATGHNGNELVSKNVGSQKEIAELIGKEAAEKLVNDPSRMEGRNHVLEGNGLKVGGEGMKGFYDKMIPNALEKMGKEHGVKVKQSDIAADKEGWKISPPEHTVSGKWMVKSNDYNSKGNHFDTKAEAEKFLETKIKTEPVHYIDIPQSLKDTVLRKGQPLFAAGIPLPLMPVDHDPWKKK